MNNLGYPNRNYFNGDVFVNANETVAEDLTVNGDLVVDGAVIIPTVEVDTVKTNHIEGLINPVNNIDLSTNNLSLQWKSFGSGNTNQLVGDEYTLSLTGFTNPELVAYGLQTNYISAKDDTFVAINNITYPDTDGSAGQVMTATGTGSIVFSSLPSISNVSQNDFLFQLDPVDPYTQLANILPFLGCFVYSTISNGSIPQNVSINTITNYPDYLPPDSNVNYLLFNPETVTNYFSYKDNTGTPGYTSPIAMSQTGTNTTYYQKVIIPIFGSSITRAYESVILDIAFKGYITNNSINIYVSYKGVTPTASVNSLFTATESGAILLRSYTNADDFEYKYVVREQFNLQPSALSSPGLNAYIVIEQVYNTGNTLNAQNSDGLTLCRCNVVGSFVSSGGYTNVPVTSIPHQDLLGLSSDEHPQYALLAGRSGDTLSINNIQPFSGPSVDVSSLSVNSAYTLPTSDGTNTYVLSTNGSGVVSWVAPPSASGNSSNVPNTLVLRDVSGNFSAGGVDVTKISIGNTSSLIAFPSTISVIGNTNDYLTSTNFYNSADSYPLLQILPFDHENVSINFDSYFDGSQWTASANNVFQINKQTSELQFSSAGGLSQGDPISWNVNMRAKVDGTVDISSLSINNNTYTLPTSDGSSGNVLSTNGSGIVSWVAPVTEQGPTGGITGHTIVGGSVVSVDDTFSGSIGATSYRISDIVDALKLYGLLQN